MLWYICLQYQIYTLHNVEQNHSWTIKDFLQFHLWFIDNIGDDIVLTKQIYKKMINIAYHVFAFSWFNIRIGAVQGSEETCYMIYSDSK